MLRKRAGRPSEIYPCCATLLLLMFHPQAQAAKAKLGLFQHHSDVGTVLHRGSAIYDRATGTYTLTGSGENMWFGTDDFQFVWKKVSAMPARLTLTADISFVGTSSEPHRKAVLMIRQSLAADSVYADVALHGIGLTALQFRDAPGAITREVEANLSAPPRLRIVMSGDYFYMFLGNGRKLAFIAGSPRIPLKAPFYIGLGVCAHNKDHVETANFSNVRLKIEPAASDSGARTAPSTALYSTLETVTLDSGDRRAIYTTPGRIEAPNWTPDGQWLIFDRQGKIEKIPAKGGEPEIIPTGIASDVNNDHGVSPDGSKLAISNQTPDGRTSIIYILPMAGGTPRRITKNSPSWFHGWSPDGKTITYCGARGGEYDIFTIPAAGGAETQLTRNEGHNDGPEFSPDGKYIYFNSDRTGREQIWRMRPDGSHPERVTHDDSNDWFPHLSPDGKWMVFMSYAQDIPGHPAGQDVKLRLMSLPDGKITTLAKLFGGQGTINVNSWSPDSAQFAFVSYNQAPQ